MPKRIRDEPLETFHRSSPKVVVVAGPNGAGKSTSAIELLRGAFQVGEFVNADDIAGELSPENPDAAAIEAGRRMLSQIHDLAEKRASFAFETTLASRTFAPWIKRLVGTGYQFYLVFLWLPTEAVAVSRVQERVQRGGHSVAESTIRRRYRAGIRNFFELYQPLAKSWQVIDNSREEPFLIAAGYGRRVAAVSDKRIWKRIKLSTQS